MTELHSTTEHPFFRVPTHFIVRSNGIWCPFRLRSEVPSYILEQFKAFVSPQEDSGFIRFDGRWYHYTQFLKAPEDLRRASDWDGFLGTSNGLAIRISDDGERYQ